MSPLLVSLGYYAYVFLSCELLRQITRPLLGKDSFTRRCLLEFLGSLEICVCVFEGSIVGQYYGDGAYFFSVAGVIWLHSYLKRDGIHSNPSSLFEDWLLGRGGLRSSRAAALLASQCAAGWLGYHGARLFWRLEFSPEHGERFRDFRCTTDLTVGVAAGMFYEGAATLWDRVFWLLAEDGLEPRLAVVAGSLEVATTTLIGVSYTGMYFNPILASTMSLGCAGLGLFQHLLVYWIASFIGHCLGTFLHSRLLLQRSQGREAPLSPGVGKKKEE